MDADTLSRAASRTEFVASRDPGFMMTMASGAAADLAECAAALVGLVAFCASRGFPEPETPWWGIAGEDGLYCVGCKGSDEHEGDGEDWAKVDHESSCSALRADAAIRRLAGEEVGDGNT